MSRWIKKIVTSLAVVAAFGVTVLAANNSAYADVPGGAKFSTGSYHVTWAGSSSANPGDCPSYGSCNGYSWIFYEYVGPSYTVGNGVTVKFRPDQTRNDWPQASQNVDIPSECSEHKDVEGSGFWHFGQNAQALSSKNYGGYFANLMYLNGMGGNAADTFTYNSSAGSWGHIFTANYGYGKNSQVDHNSGLNQVIYKDGQAMYSASAGGKSAALDAYKKAVDASGGNPNDVDDFPDDLYGFCYWPGMGSTPAAQSSVGVNTGSGFKYATTSITKTTDKKELSGSTEKDKTITVSFLHNPYSENSSEQSWTITDAGTNQLVSSDKYTVSESYIGTSGANGSASLTTQSGSYYTLSGRPGVDGSGNFFFTQRNFNITFKETGDYKFCQKFVVGGTATTEVCANIKVGSNGYYGRSNVWNSKGDTWATTDVTPTTSPKVSTPARTKNVTLYLNQDPTAQVVFSHDIFADMPNVGASWRVERSVTINGSVKSGFTGGGFTPTLGVLARSGDANTYKSGTTKEANGYYQVGPNNYTDGGYYYIFREVLNMRFTAVGSYDFCETLTVNGTAVTKACTKITVKRQCTGSCCGPVDCPDDDPDDPDDPPGGDTTPDSSLCQTWAPPSYTSSSTYEGTTSAWARVINNGSILTGYRQQLSGVYSGWRGILVEGDKLGAAQNAADKITYARPGDNLRWLNCYYPGVQSVANTEVTYVHIDPSHPTSSVIWHANDNRPYSSLVFGQWQNQYSINSETDTKHVFGGAIPSARLNLGSGNKTIQWSSNTYPVKVLNDTGKYFQETITTGGPVYVSLNNEGIHTWGCVWGLCCDCDRYGCHSYCWCNQCGHTNHRTTVITRIEGPVVSGAARVEVPYNFENTTSVSVSTPTDQPVYSGYTVQVNLAEVTVNQKYNSMTEDTYATQVDGAKLRLVAYVSNTNEDGQTTTMHDASGSANLCSSGSWAIRKQCNINASADGVALNYDKNLADLLAGGSENGQFKIPKGTGSNYETTTTESFENTYTVFDADAGDYMCFAMAVWPQNSYTDTNLDASGNKTWTISKTCRVIAKKPTFQISGGSLYANGEVETAVSAKYNVYGQRGYFVTRPSDWKIYSSVVEQSVVGLSSVKGLASAASTLLANGLTPSLGGLENNSGGFCQYRTALSIANFSSSLSMCPDAGSETVGFAGTTYSTTDRAALVNYWVPSESSTNFGGGSFNLNNLASDAYRIASASGRVIRYLYSASDLSTTANDVTIGADTTYVIRANGNITINGNLYYANTSYASTGAIPKIVIYATGNIIINCNVRNIDAILIAGNGTNGAGKVWTCDTYGSVNADSHGNKLSDADDARRSLDQLNIRGAVIADELILGRTYGAAAGAESGIPAEAINYDTSAILWGRYMAGAGESDTLTVTYQHELAPRY